MTRPALPVVRQLLDAGADDHAYDAFMLAGPVLIAVLAVFGRTSVTEALAALYVLSFFGYVLYNGVPTSEHTEAGPDGR